MGVWYEAGTLSPSAVLRDLQAIRALGFNHVKTLVRWDRAEQVRGAFRLEPLDQFLTLADQAGIRVIVQPQPEPPPEWAAGSRADAALISAFTQAIASRAKAHASFHAIDAIGDPYRVSMYPRPRDGTPWSPAQLAWRLDAIRSAAGDRGWSIGELQAGPAAHAADRAADVTGADVRLWTWAAIARGARAITFASWSAESSPAGPTYTGLAGADGALTDRARAAGQTAGTISRNAELFARVRPRRSRVAIVHNPLWDAAPFPASALAYGATAALHRRLFEANVPVDIIFPAEILLGEAGAYMGIFAAAPGMLPRPVGEALDRYARAGGRVMDDPGTDLAPFQSDVRVNGGNVLVETRFLESVDTLLLVGLNHADTPKTVTFAFPPDTPEAIWQNMETGASVSFVQGPEGLIYQHAFAPRDVMVLMIRTRLR